MLLVKYLNKFESNIKYSIIKYISVLELHNKKNMKCSIDKNEGSGAYCRA